MTREYSRRVSLCLNRPLKRLIKHIPKQLPIYLLALIWHQSLLGQYSKLEKHYNRLPKSSLERQNKYSNLKNLYKRLVLFFNGPISLLNCPDPQKERLCQELDTTILSDHWPRE